MLKSITTFESGTIYLHEACDACRGVAVANVMEGDVVFCGTLPPTEEETQIVFLSHNNEEPLWETPENALVITIDASMLAETHLSMALAHTNEALFEELEKLLPEDNAVRILRESIRAQNEGT